MTADGQRLWLRPRLSKGRFLTARRGVAYFLIALFFGLPWITLNGHPAVLLDIIHRRFYIGGYTFLPTDTFLLAIFLLTFFVSIFLFTALLGRLWCGWACPQTVYLEFIYRPLERLFERTIGRGGPPKESLAGWRKPTYFFAALLVTALPAHTFLAYFVGVDSLRHWITGNPFNHPTAFLVMAITTILMFFDFYWFREQLCLIACPYGRFQSVLLDKWSMIVSYDKRRGEPRGRMGARASQSDKSIALPLLAADTSPLTPDPSTSVLGDCIDCHLCVTTCPTGIDIRDGLQMECVNCTQCINACDVVMDKINRPRGLIRYSSQARINGENSRRLRPRVILYPVILLILITVFVVVFSNKGTADVTLLRNLGNPFVTLPNGDIANALRIKIQNRTESPQAYHLEIIGLPEARLRVDQNPMPVAPDKNEVQGFIVELPPHAFRGAAGMLEFTLRVRDDAGFTQDLAGRLLGPAVVAAKIDEEKKDKGAADDHSR